MIALFSATLFLSAGLMFLVQPMFARFVLPLLGSTPAVWTASMLFFQTALLAGYLYAHESTRRLGVRRQAGLHVGLLALPLLVLPIGVPDGWIPPAEGNPVPWLLGLLAIAVGLPFFIVSSTAPLLQRWLAATDHAAAADPYFLYRASNLGSVLGLLAYPLAIEPGLRLAEQGWVWSLGYGLLAALILACVVALWRSPMAPGGDAAMASSAPAAEPGRRAVPAADPEQAADPEPAADSASATRPSRARRLRWIGLAFVPSSLMLGVTTFITTDVAPIPLLWAIPLSLYLGSFILVFAPGARALRLHRWMVFALPGVVLLLSILLLLDVPELLLVFVPLHLGGFFVAALVCHGELAQDRPPARHLTEFYLLVAVGGALGGLFNGVVAPAVFDSLAEYPLAIVLAALCLPRRAPRIPPGPIARWLDFALPLAVGGTVALVLALVELAGAEAELPGKSFAFGLAAGIGLNFVRRPLRFGLTVGAIVLGATLAIGTDKRELYQERSFFGVYRVTAADGDFHELVHGTTTHGAQDRSPGRARTPLTYFHPSGPVGQLLANLPPAITDRVAVIGLGTGSMACHSERGERWTFYEVDPTVERIARDPGLFTYLRDCAGELDVVLGDARLSLSRAPRNSFGLIVADAFSSDAIPVHLLTREALALYRSRLRAHGIMAFHITNRFLDLEPVLGNLARDASLACMGREESRVDERSVKGKLASHWVVIAERSSDLPALELDPRWHACRRSPGSALWADDFSNLIGALELD